MTKLYKPSYFLAGKMNGYGGNQERIPVIDLSWDNIRKICDKYGGDTNILFNGNYKNCSVNEKVYRFTNWTRTVSNETIGRIPYLCALSDYKNLKKPFIPKIIHDTYRVSGPALILNGFVWNHGFNDEWYSMELDDDDYDIVSKRNREMIMYADVFSLEINEEFDCMQSIVESGIAWEKGKTIVIFFEEPEEGCEEELIKTETDFNKHINKRKKYLQKRKDFHMLIRKSIKSLQQNENRDVIIKCHPSLEMNTFEEYKQYLQDILGTELELEPFSEFKIRQVAKRQKQDINLIRQMGDAAVDIMFNQWV